MRGYQPHMSALDSIGFGGATSRPKVPLEQVTRGPDATPPGPGGSGDDARYATSDISPSPLTASCPCPNVRETVQVPRRFFNAFLLPWVMGGPPGRPGILAGSLLGQLGQGNKTCRRRFVLS